MIDDQVRDHTNDTSLPNNQRKDAKTNPSDKHMDVDENLSVKLQEYIYLVFSALKDFFRLILHSWRD